MEALPDNKSQIQSQAAVSDVDSVTESQTRRAEQDKIHQARVAEIKKNYVSMFADDEPAYKSKMVGLNPNMRPSANQSLKKIFPM